MSAQMPHEDDRIVAMIDAGHCPDCRYRGFILGPRGGNSINIECGNVHCRARFNVGSFSGNHHIVMAQRISRECEGGSDWSE